MQHRGRLSIWEHVSSEAVRLAREDDWGNSPRIVSRISDSISMAKRIYDKMKDEFQLA
jgi:hypothetical protein